MRRQGVGCRFHIESKIVKDFSTIGFDDPIWGPQHMQQRLLFVLYLSE